MNAQQEIIKTLGVKATINPENEIARRTEFLTKYLVNSGLKGFVLGISGGQDSLLAGLLAQKAVNKLKDVGDNAAFHAVLLPYGDQADRDDAELACQVIGPDYIHDWNIKPGVDSLANSYSQAEGRNISDFHKGNIKARLRMVAQYAIAGENDLLVIGTDHAAEAVTGFFTKYGDGGADILPLSGLTKRQGRQMLEFLGVPKKLYLKKPTADLLDGMPGNPDEVELNLSYNKIDDYLEGKPVDQEIAKSIEDRYTATQHKRDLPVTLFD